VAVLAADEVVAADLSPPEIYARSIGAVCTIVTAKDGKAKNLGSGFIVSSDGLVATNQHVVANAPTILVKCGQRDPVQGILRTSDAEVDLALIETGLRSAQTLALSSEEPSRLIGRAVYVIGSPQGLEGTISNGLVSGVRQVGEISVIQISAPISPGSSGGPVLLADGSVIGVATAVVTSGQNLNFAVPAALLRKLPKGAAPVASHVAATAREERPPPPPENMAVPARLSPLLGAQDVIDKTCPTYPQAERAACRENGQATLHEAWVNCWEREAKPLKETWGGTDGTRRALGYCACLVRKVPADIFLRHGLYRTLREVGEVVATSQGATYFGFTPARFTEEQWSEMVRATINATRECR
jgi:hypothetical protein